ncbi:MAG TPA: IS200/IS605 family transposase [Cytophagales bacterium]|nr:IS200/IS605 family transposase [Cytophagales bacterium]
MPNTYTQIHIHAVFVVKYQQGLIQPEWKDELYKYITGIIQHHHHKLLAINGMPDHVHIFFGMRPVQSLSELMQDVKGSSSKWINEQKFLRGRFEWQEGYGAFSHSMSNVPTVIQYIQNQESHHKQQTFMEEYTNMLTDFSIDFDERYLFKPLE